MRGETFEQTRERLTKQDETGAALAAARWERGQRTLSEDERFALDHDTMFGSDGYPVRRLGRGWVYDSRAAKAPRIFRTKAEAVAAWETTVAIWRALDALASQERHLAEEAAR